ncbi:MAG TPA: ribonuclease Y [Gemmataceae bacterium]|nr:ribonuclease Y [Gemmataceae bacterium]
MLPEVLAVLGIVLALIGGAVLGFAACRWLMKGKLEDARAQARDHEEQAQARAKEILDQARADAERTAKDAELQARDELFQKREAFNRETEQARADLRDQERRLEKKEAALEVRHKEVVKKDKAVEHTQKKLADRKEAMDRREKELEELIQEHTTRLHQVSGLSRDQAERLLLERVERELTDQIATKLSRHEETFRSEAEQKAREILATAVQRYAAPHTAAATVSTVDIPSDDMKGRIIGREGRNIRTFEKATGVDVIVDDTPGVVIVSAFDNVRRETARLSLAKLIQDGRIHPTRIEEVVAETQKEMEAHIMAIGKAAVTEADCGPVHEKLIQLLGRLRFRTSYSQNVLNHSLEVCHLTGMMAAELGLDARLARRCALLHDVGKAADHEMEGGHPKIGAELAKRYGETSKEVLHAIAGHHDDITIDHIYTVLVAAADAISASRPGARRETLEKYVKRLEELEAVACGFPGVDQAFAIQAGRELRVIANAHRTTDAEAQKVCHDIARAIEQQLDYPGEIKVTVVRETRTVEIAR